MPTLADALRGYQPPTTSALADPIKEHFRTLPQQLETNQRAMDKTIGGMFQTDFLGKPNPNYYPEAMQEFTQGYAPNVAGMMIGPSSPLWNKKVVFKAAKMLKEGVSPQEVWKQTLTGKGLDNQFRQEISDQAMKFNEPEIDKFRRMRNVFDVSDTRKSKMNLYDLVTHDNLRKGYPESNELAVLRGMSEEGGATSPNAWDGVILGVEPANHWFPKKDSIQSMRETLLHELQHNVQAAEGFNKGGNPAMFKTITPTKAQQQKLDKLKADYEALPFATPERRAAIEAHSDLASKFDPFGQYHNLGGEAESRMTARRADLDEAARREHYPFERSRYGLDINPDSALIMTEFGEKPITRKQMLKNLLKENK
jgi:hypothetical protein